VSVVRRYIANMPCECVLGHDSSVTVQEECPWINSTDQQRPISVDICLKQWSQRSHNDSLHCMAQRIFLSAEPILPERHFGVFRN